MTMKIRPNCVPVLQIVLLFISLCHGNDSFFNDNGNLELPKTDAIGWMKAIEDYYLLSGITIPGTHDSMALYGGPAAECQAWDLKNQLRAGVRYLDLRVFALEDTLYVMHGIMYQHTTFSEVFETIRAFLSEFTSEVVLVRVKPEFFDKERVEGMVENLISNNEDVWVSSQIPSIGQVRGKVVFVQKSDFKLGVPLLETDTKDDYEVSDVADKEKTIEIHLGQATPYCGGDDVVLTYSSGTGIGTFWGMFLTPKRVAEKVNPWLNQYLRQFYADQPRPCFGIIAMDFPGTDLIQTVIGFNTW